jgi:hypothetical protein
MGFLSRASGSAAEKIKQFHETHRRFGCVLIKHSGEENFSRQITEMIGSIGFVIPLESNYPLILFPPSTDWELISHRLSKCFKGASWEGTCEELLSFEANCPEDVFKRIKSR